MQQYLIGLVDHFIPHDLKHFQLNEELDRARGLVLVLFIYLTIAVLALFGQLTDNDMARWSDLRQLLSVSIAVAGYTAALLLFSRTGHFLLAGNLFGFSYYQSTLIVASIQPESAFGFTMLHILVVPLLVSCIANYLSGVIWLAIITISPIAISQLGIREIPAVMVPSWLITSVSLLLAMTLSHYYRERMVLRLQNECAHFEFAAAHDSLTGLANRQTFDRRLEAAIHCCSSENKTMVLAYIDLDKFKPVNDNYGHLVGDRVLVTVAQRLQQLVRRTDTVARLGGDEFAILFDHCDPADVRPLLARLQEHVSQPMRLGGVTLQISCSIGVVVCPDDGCEADQLSHIADERMYLEKRLGQERQVHI